MTVKKILPVKGGHFREVYVNVGPGGGKIRGSTEYFGIGGGRKTPRRQSNH